MKLLDHIIIFAVLCTTAKAQTGTYQKYDSTGASCTIAIESNKSTVKADVFAWWNTPSGRHGVFSGEGPLKNNICILKGNDEDKDCQVTLTFSTHKLTAVFSDCMADNLPEDFSGAYTKITNFTPGPYIVRSDRAYFYKKANLNTRSKAYLVKGDKVVLDLENITANGWTFINYKNASGKTTSAYMLLKELTKKN